MKKTKLAAILVFAILLGAMAAPVWAAADAGIKSYSLPGDVLLERVTAAATPNQVSYVDFYNIDAVAYSDIKLAADAAKQAKANVLINFHTLSGDEVNGRVAINPQLANSDMTANFIVDVSAAATAEVEKKFEELLEKPVAVMRCGQAGDFGMLVAVSGKLDLTGMNSGNLVAYTYDVGLNQYSEIKNAKCTADAGGFTHLQTSKGGYILITEK